MEGKDYGFSFEVALLISNGGRCLVEGWLRWEKEEIWREDFLEVLPLLKFFLGLGSNVEF